MATDSNWSLLPSAKKSKRCNNLQLATGEVARPTQRDLRCGATGGKVCSGPNWSLTSAQRLNGSQLAAGELARLAHLTHPLHPFERRSAVTPILGGLQLRSSKRHRQLKTAKQKPRKQTKSQGGGNLSRKKSGQGCPRDFAHPRGRIFRLLRTALVPSKPKVQSAHSKSSSSSSRTTVSGVSRRHQWGDQSPKLPGSTCKSSSWS